MHRSQNQHETNHETNHETKKMLLASEDAHHCALLVMGSGFTAGAACVPSLLAFASQVGK
jgi:hypothetical protein